MEEGGGSIYIGQPFALVHHQLRQGILGGSTASWTCQNGQHHSSVNSALPMIVEATLDPLGASLLGLNRTCEAMSGLGSIGVAIP